MNLPLVAPIPDRLSEQEVANVKEYAGRDTKKLKANKHLSRWLDFFLGICSAAGTVYADILITEHRYEPRSIALVVGLFAAAAALFLWNIRITNRLDLALTLSPFESYLRLQGLEMELAYLGGEKQSCEVALNAVIAHRDNEIATLKNTGSTSATTFGSWATLMQATHQSMIEFSRGVNEMLDRRQADRKHNGEALPSIDNNFRKVLDDLVSSLKKDRVSLFGHIPMYGFFDVFELKDEVCYRIARATCGGPMEHGRKWGLHEGHIGESIILARPLLKNIPANQRDLAKERQSVETDAEYFQSAIYAPIPAIDRKPHNFYGVLVVTSSAIDGLNALHLALVDTLAHSIAGAFITRQRAYRRVAGKNLYGIKSRSKGESDNGTEVA